MAEQTHCSKVRPKRSVSADGFPAPRSTRRIMTLTSSFTVILYVSLTYKSTVLAVDLFAPVVCLQHTRFRAYVSAKRERQRNLFRAGCLPPTYTLPRVCFGKARTPTEARRAAPRLGLYIQDNDVHGGVPCVPPLCIVFLDFPSARLTAAERRYKVAQSAKPSFASTICCAPLTLAKGVRIKVTHLRDLFRPDARNFPRRREAGFGDVRRIFAFYPAQICAVQISGVIIEKSRRSCCFRCSPRLSTSDKLE